MSRSGSSGWAAIPDLLPALAIPGVIPQVAIETLLGRVPLYVAAATFGFVVIALLDRRTTLKTSRGFAVALVVMSAVTAGGLWLTAEWIAHALFAREFVGGNDHAMWTLIHLTAAGLVTGVLFDWVVGPSGQDVKPAEAIRGIDRSDGRPLSVRLRIVPDRQRQLVWTMRLGLAASVFLGLLGGDVGMALDGAIALVLTLLPAVLNRKAGFPIDPGLALWITSAIFLHALGTFWLYDATFWWSNLTHFVSATLVGAVGYTGLRAIDARRPEIYLPPPLTAAFVIPFVFTVGVGWEIAEFAIDAALNGLGYGELADVQYGLADTMSDLALDALGASIVAIWGTAYLVDVAATLSDRLRSEKA